MRRTLEASASTGRRRQASETPTAADLARIDREVDEEDKSNTEWTHPQEPELVGPEWLASAVGIPRDRLDVTPAELADRLHLTSETFTAVIAAPTKHAKPLSFTPQLIHGSAARRPESLCT